MALVLKDRVKETSTTAGTGTITLAGAVAGFQSFAAVGNGNSTYYAIVDPATGAWEVGIGTYTSSGTTLSRTTVLSSSNSGSLVSFAANSKDVFVTYPSERAVWLDSAGNVLVQYEFNTINATTANITTANLTSGTISTTPTNNTDIVNKQYADAIASGIHFHEAVDLATTAALPANTYNNGTSGVGATLTANANGALSVDSTLTVVGNRILVKNEVTQANNGVYTVTQVGSAGTPYILTRATDFDSVGTGVDQIDEGDFFLVTSGTANVNTAWVQQTPPPITIGTTPIVFQQFSAPITYTAGTGLSESPTYTFNIANTGTAGTYGSASAVPVFVTNAQGQVTSVTNTNIAINGSVVTGNISGSAGSVANALTLGTYLTGTSFNGSAAVTATVDATSANTASKVVARDASGNFSAGTITATLSGSSTSATTATNLAGGAANRIPYQTAAGTTAFTTAASGTNYVLNYNGSAFTWVSGTISGVALGSNLNSLTAGTYLTGTAYNGSAAQTWTVDATSANTASKVVARDASGNFSAGTITATLSGTATNVSGTVAVANGGTGLTSLTAGYIPFGAGTSAFGNSANLFWDSANARLGIGTSSPAQKLDVNGQLRVGQSVASAYQSVIIENTASNGYARATFNVGSGGANGQADVSYAPGIFFAVGPSANDTTTPIVFRNNNATERMRIINTGEVGIGTSSPTAKLDVYAATNPEVRLTSASDGYLQIGQFTNGAYIGTSSSDTTDGVLKFGTATTEKMRITTTGNVGIGTSSPAQKLDVNGSIAIRANNTLQLYNADNTNNFQLYNSGATGSTNGNLIFLAGAVGERMRLDSAGNLGIGTTSVTNARLKVSSSSAAGAIMSEDTSGTTSFVRILGDASSQNLLNWQDGTALRFATSTQAYGSYAERARITSSGAWSFGSSGTATGTSGQVLTSNGSGAAPSWQTSAAAAKGFAVGMSLVFGR
jgi:hypothetical protein